MPRNHTPRQAIEPAPAAVLLCRTDDGGRQSHHDDQLIDCHGLDDGAAAKLIAACTQVGDLVADLTASQVIATAVDGLERHLHTPRSAVSPKGLAQLLIDRLERNETQEVSSITEWVQARRSALASAGHLVITVEPARPHTDAQPVDAAGGVVDRLTEVIAAARAAGLTYIQHLVTIHPPGHGSPEPATPNPRTSRRVRTHSDLLVFRAPHATGVERGA